jgi:hypothetical protein
MKKFSVISIALLALLFTGCGYRVGSLMHPQIKSIAIAPVTNDTMMYNVAAQMRGLLAECFQSDGSLKLVNEGTADCILYAKVTNAKFSQVSWSDSNNDNDFLPSQWSVSISAKITVMIPGRATPLIRETSISGSSQFSGGPDLETSRTSAVRQACFEAAKQAVAKVTEAW